MAFNPNDHMMKLKGKDYLQVAWRLVWFREERPLWCINTELLAHDTDAKHAIFKATIFDDNGIQKSSGFGSESVKDFGDYIEKAETKAVGRALAMLGYGTQFAPDLDEGERIVDSPIDMERGTLLRQINDECNARGIKSEALAASCRKNYGKGLNALDNNELSDVLAKIINK